MYGVEYESRLGESVDVEVDGLGKEESNERSWEQLVDV